MASDEAGLGQLKRNVLITGASGLLGRSLMSSFKSSGWNVTGLAFSRAKEGLLKVDLNCEKSVEEIISSFAPTLLVHSAAQRSPDKMDNELEKSYQLNVQTTKFLAQSCANR